MVSLFSYPFFTKFELTYTKVKWFCSSLCPEFSKRCDLLGPVYTVAMWFAHWTREKTGKHTERILGGARTRGTNRRKENRRKGSEAPGCPLLPRLAYTGPERSSFGPGITQNHWFSLSVGVCCFWKSFSLPGRVVGLFWSYGHSKNLIRPGLAYPYDLGSLLGPAGLAEERR